MYASDANTLAYLALLVWGPLTVVLFFCVRPPTAAAVALLGAIMFLPERVEFDLPAIPPFTKWTIASTAVLLACLLRTPHRLVQARPGRGIDVLFIILCAAALGTALSNSDPLFYGSVHLIGLDPYEALSMVTRDFLAVAIPFFVGRALFRTSRDLRTLLTVLVVAGLLYSLFIWVEIRLSPQWHRWIYGFHQHSFAQTFRYGGYRPMVFMHHGLALALFVHVVTLACVALHKARISVFNLPRVAVIGYLLLTLVACKSTGAWLYGLLFVPVVWFFRPTAQIRVAVLVAVIVIAYPVLRASQLFPTDALVAAAQNIAAERAHSIEFRFNQEDQLFAKATERLAYGWGAFGRNHVYNERGRDLSITDGYWIIMVSSRGIIGAAAAFALLLLPIFATGWRLRRIRAPRDRRLLAGLAMIVAVYTLDLLPNGMFSDFPFFLSGALWRLCHSLPTALRQRQSYAAQAPDSDSAKGPNLGLAPAGESEQ